MGIEFFYELKGVLKAKGLSMTVGGEGGFAPNPAMNEETIANC